jgi:hypothetical protein
MYPLSEYFLEKMYGRNLFDIGAPGGSRSFSFTVYSQSAFNLFYNSLESGKVLQWPNKNEDIYFKYLKSLDSKLILIELGDEGAWEILNSFSRFKKGQTWKPQPQYLSKSRYAWLMITKAADTMQPFDYGLIRLYDEKIRDIEIQASLSRLKSKIA